LDELFAEASWALFTSGQADAASLASARLAIQTARRLLRQSPTSLESRLLIAADQLRVNQAVRAIVSLQDAPEAIIESALAQRLLGHAFRLTKDLETADRHFRASARLQPWHPDPWYGRGKIAELRGTPDRAISFYERGAFFEERGHACVLSLVRLYLDRQEVRHAIAAVRPALARSTRSAVLNETYASLLLRRAARLRRRRQIDAAVRSADEALQHLRTAAEVAPTTERFTRIGTGELRRERFPEARRAFESALRLNPLHRPALARLAGLNVDEGDIQLAKSQFQSLIESGDASALAHFRNSRISRFCPCDDTDRYIGSLRQQLNQASLGNSARVQILFTLAKVLDDCGCFDEAWVAYHHANQLKLGRRSHGEDAGRMKRFVADQIATIDRDFFDRFRGCGDPSTMPIFIVGMPRSGTTLTEQILSCHDDVSGAGELKHVERLRCRLFRSWQQRLLDRDGCVYPFSDLRYPLALQVAEPDDFRWYAGEYLDRLQTHRQASNHVTDKMPTNFNHLGLIAVCFPGATIIHCRRDPMDVLVSAFCQNLTPPFCDPDLLADYYIQYRRLMDHWTRVLPLRIIDVDYETLVRSPEASTRQLIGDCGLPWQEACLRFDQNRRAVHTPSKYQVRQPMYSTSIGKWHRFGRQLQPIADKLAAYR